MIKVTKHLHPDGTVNYYLATLYDSEGNDLDCTGQGRSKREAINHCKGLHGEEIENLEFEIEKLKYLQEDLAVLRHKEILKVDKIVKDSRTNR